MNPLQLLGLLKWFSLLSKVLKPHADLGNRVIGGKGHVASELRK
jgi:hypothetical protein